MVTITLKQLFAAVCQFLGTVRPVSAPGCSLAYFDGRAIYRFRFQSLQISGPNNSRTRSKLMLVSQIVV
jgi:hypothetical protein